MAIEDLMKMEPRELAIYTATKVYQIYEEELPEIKKRLESGDGRFDNHEGRLLVIETEKKVKANYGLNGLSVKKKAVLVVGGGGGVLTTVVVILMSAGKVLGWW